MEKTIRCAVKLCLNSGSNHPIHIEGIIKLVIRLSDLHASFTFGVFDHFVVPILLDTSYINRFITATLLLELLIVPVHLRLVAIFALYSYDNKCHAYGLCHQGL